MKDVLLIILLVIVLSIGAVFLLSWVFILLLLLIGFSYESAKFVGLFLAMLVLVMLAIAQS